MQMTRVWRSPCTGPAAILAEGHRPCTRREGPATGGSARCRAVHPLRLWTAATLPAQPAWTHLHQQALALGPASAAAIAPPCPASQAQHSTAHAAAPAHLHIHSPGHSLPHVLLRRLAGMHHPLARQDAAPPPDLHASQPVPRWPLGQSMQTGSCSFKQGRQAGSTQRRAAPPGGAHARPQHGTAQRGTAWHSVPAARMLRRVCPDPSPPPSLPARPHGPAATAG